MACGMIVDHCCVIIELCRVACCVCSTYWSFAPLSSVVGPAYALTSRARPAILTWVHFITQPSNARYTIAVDEFVTLVTFAHPVTGTVTVGPTRRTASFGVEVDLTAAAGTVRRTTTFAVSSAYSTALTSRHTYGHFFIGSLFAAHYPRCETFNILTRCLCSLWLHFVPLYGDHVVTT